MTRHEVVSAPRNDDGRIEAFGRGTDNALWHIWRTSPGGGWSAWNSPGGTLLTA